LRRGRDRGGALGKRKKPGKVLSHRGGTESTDQNQKDFEGQTEPQKRAILKVKRRRLGNQRGAEKKLSPGGEPGEKTRRKC